MNGLLAKVPQDQHLSPVLDAINAVWQFAADLVVGRGIGLRLTNGFPPLAPITQTSFFAARRLDRALSLSKSARRPTASRSAAPCWARQRFVCLPELDHELLVTVPLSVRRTLHPRVLSAQRGS
jgi:hypothetical protein